MDSSNSKSEQFLLEYLEHISYEIIGVVTSYIRLSKLSEYGACHPIGEQGEKNDSLDLMTMHFRNLVEFFCYASKKDCVRASDYVKNFTFKIDAKLIEKVNNQVSHLTVKRHELAGDFSTKSWDPNDIMKWLLSAFNAWRKDLGDKYRKEINNRTLVIKDFLDWYEDQVRQGVV